MPQQSKPLSFRRLFRKGRDRQIDEREDLPSGLRLNTTTTTSQPIAGEEDDGGEQDAHSRPHDHPSQGGLAPEKCGLFLLNEEIGQKAKKHSVDVVAIHGLGGDAYETWMHNNGKMWLRDFLPVDIPGARIFIYGYDSTFVFSRETSTLREYARALLEDIRSKRTHPDVFSNVSSDILSIR